jgi:hypothetical protein
METRKCICEKPGFCPVFQKEMGVNPPNWEWCQNADPIEREKYLKAQNKSIRTLSTATHSSNADLIDFYDEIPTPKSKYAVVTVAANQYAMEHLDVVRDSITDYAKKCNADYIELTGDQSPDWPIANKWRIKKVTSTYEKTLYLDCDIFINSWCPNLFELTPDDKISAVNELPCFEQPTEGGNLHGLKWIIHEQEMLVHKFGLKPKHPIGYHMLNGGLMMIPKELSEYYSQPKLEYPRLWCFDQQYLSMALPPDKLNYLDEKFNWEFIRQDFWEGLEKSYIVHLNYAKPNNYRCLILERIKEGNYNKIDNGLQLNKNVIQWLNPGSKDYFVVYHYARGW